MRPLLGAIVLLLAFVTPVQAHWADLAVAEVIVAETSVQVTLVFPTGLAAGADDNRDGRLSAAEVRAHRSDLETLLGEKIRISDRNQPGVLTVDPVGAPASIKNMNITPGTHSTLLLTYTWPRPLQAPAIRYGLFVPGVSTASCLATILQGSRVQTFVFTPENREFTLTLGRAGAWKQAGSFLVLGIEHILTGYDHILFLISLLILG